MALLTHEQKVFAIQKLAMFENSRSVVNALKEEFGVEVSIQNVNYLDPTTLTGRSLSREWRDFFWATRKHFTENINEIPIANEAFRLRELNRLYDESSGKRGNPKMASDLLEQAAKETGGAYTNKRELSGANGGAIQLEATVDVTKLSNAALEEIADLAS